MGNQRTRPQRWVRRALRAGLCALGASALIMLVTAWSVAVLLGASLPCAIDARTGGAHHPSPYAPGFVARVAVTRVTVTERGCGVWECDVRVWVPFSPPVSSFRGCNERVLIIWFGFVS